jgi:hypothetical protein
MARADANETGSAYYPPRARWYSPIFYLGGTIQRWLVLDRIRAHLPREIAFGGLFVGFLVPGLGFQMRGTQFLGKAALFGCGLMLLLFIAGFGYPIGNLALGGLIAIHVTGFVYYCSPLFRQEDLGFRLIFTLLAVIGIGLLIYLPIRNVVLQHWLVPLRVNDHVFVVQRQFPVAAIQRGDWIAYKLGGGSSGWETGGGHGTVHVRSGMGLGAVLAKAGDRVGFSTNVFTVNGIPNALLPHMPQSGEVTLREKQWFVWPELGISGYGNTPEGNISVMMLQLAVVSENDFVGKFYRRWLWRRQITP